MPCDVESTVPLQTQIMDLRHRLAEAELALACQLIQVEGSSTAGDDPVAPRAEDPAELYRLAFEYSSVGIGVVDHRGRWLLVNQAFCSVFGEDAATLATQSLFDLADPADRDLLRADLDLEPGQGRLVERRFQDRRRGMIWCRLNLSATLVQCCGSSRLRICQVEDVTERHQQRDEEAVERHVLAETIANAPVAIALFDTSMRYLAHSSRWLDDHDRRGELIIGRTHYEINPDIPERWREVHRRCLAGEYISADEDVFTRDDGQVHYYRWAGHPWRTPDGQIGGMVLVVARINDLVQARTAAIEASRLKSEFLANMSHEIRTPLNGVLGLAQLLLESNLSPDQRELTTTLFANGKWLLKLLNDILDFSRIESGKLVLESHGFHLPTLIAEVTQLLVSQAADKGLELLCDLDDDLPEWYVGDPDRIRQILLNLVGNAIKFTDTGEVRIAPRLIVDPATDSDRDAGQVTTRLRLSVQDTGIGVPTDKRESIFASFTQGDGSTSRLHGGTGLGLAICSSLARLLGGSIHLTSTVSQGSTFAVDLPLPILGRISDTVPTSLVGETILVADANQSVRDGIYAALEARGARVIETDDATAVVPLIRFPAVRERPTLCLVDERLAEQVPRFFEELAGRPESNRCPVILMTIGRTQKSLATHGCPVIAKPILPSSLISTITDVLRSSSELPTPTPTPDPPSVSVSSKLAGVRVLLAEDNTTNQMVAVRMLHRLGCHAEVVADGSEVLPRLDQADFDVILMDVAMPRMDGYQATAAVRCREEQRHLTHHVPIIAMTAHAMQGDRERCLAARMDDYLSKPVTITELATVLERWVGQRGPDLLSSPAPAEVAVAPALPALRLARLQELSQGDIDFERELLECLLGDVAAGMDKLDSTRDPAQLATILHGIVGACRTVGAEALGMLCRECEREVEQPGFHPDPSWFATIQAERDNLIAAVATYLDA